MEMAGLPPFLSGFHACTRAHAGYVHMYMYSQPGPGQDCGCQHRWALQGQGPNKDVGNINFFIFYHLDTSKHVLQIENYTKEWVLLQATV